MLVMVDGWLVIIKARFFLNRSNTAVFELVGKTDWANERLTRCAIGEEKNRP